MDQMLTAFTCMLSACGNNNNLPVFINSVANVQPQCELQTENIAKNLELALTQTYASSRAQFAKIEKRLKALEDALAIETTPLNRVKHSSSYPEHCPANVEGVVKIRIGNSNTFEVVCESNSYGDGWLVIATAKSGVNLGSSRDSSKASFIGLDKLHAITNNELQSLLIVATDGEGVERFGIYQIFGIANENQSYTLNSLGEYMGDLEDDLRANLGKPFSMIRLLKKINGDVKIMIKSQKL